MLCFPPLFLVIIIPNRENRSVSTMIEYFHEPSTIDSDHTGDAGIKSVELKKASEKLEVLRTAKYNIGHGEKRAFNITVGSKVTLLDIYLDWGNVRFLAYYLLAIPQEALLRISMIATIKQKMVR